MKKIETNESTRVVDLLSLRDLWTSACGNRSEIVLSSRIRLARNIAGRPFPDWAEDDCCEEIKDFLAGVLLKLPDLKKSFFFDLDELETIDKEILYEKHFISKEFMNSDTAGGLVLSRDGRISVMINEEDHLRIQIFSCGLRLKDIFKKAIELDRHLEEYVDYAFSNKWGYLTACPSNVGTGIRASAMVHLIGLKLIGELAPVLKGLGKLGFAVRGVGGEGTDAFGDLFQISNQSTLGDTEDHIVDNLYRMIKEIVSHEENARIRLWENRRLRIVDYVGRSLGLLKCVQLLSSRETIDLLSGLRLGVYMGLIKNLDIDSINSIMFLTQAGHIQKIMKKKATAEERDEFRAFFVRQKLADVDMVF